MHKKFQEHLTNNANEDKWKDILVLLNGNQSDKTIKIPADKWTLAGDGNTINEKGIKQITDTQITLPAITAYLL